MPQRHFGQCNWRGCAALTRRRYCADHEREDRKRRESAIDETRVKFHRLYGRKWRAIRADQLRDEPHCRKCAARGRTRRAVEVDHITAHRGDRSLFFDRGNLQSLCKPCHSRKTAHETGFAKSPAQRRRATVAT